MSENKFNDFPEEGAALPPEGEAPAPLSGEEWERLRSLLLGREIAAIRALRERLDNHDLHARELSEVVAEAILLRTQKDQTIEKVLQPTVEEIFQNNLRRNPHQVVNHLFPLMGPAIRRSITETFRSMMQSFSRTLEMSFSWRGLQWRLEAMRTGRSFSDIVMIHTLLYRVEQVFLIHTETGIVLDYAENEGIKSQDADLVSAMLTAVQDFVKDCFAGGGQAAALESLQMGDLTILVERTPQAYIACVVRGTPPADFAGQINTSLELIILECAEEFKQFAADGDSGPFKKIRRHLLDCLDARYIEEKRKAPFFIRYLPAALLLFLVIAFGGLKYQQYKYESMVEELGRQPGVVITAAEPSLLGSWRLSCLRDDLAVDPSNFLVEAGMAQNRFHIDVYSYISLDGDIVKRRVEEAIKPPPGVRMSFSDEHVLRLSGDAPLGWIIATREKALTTPGVKDVDTSLLKDPLAQELNQLMARIDGTIIYFPLNKDLPETESAPKLIEAVDNIVALEKLAANMGMGITVTIYGHADAIGNEKYNYDLSQARAKTVAAMLYARGSSVPISTYGMGADFAAYEDGKPIADPGSRKIILKVHLARLAAMEQWNP
ncbi:MAG: OmpA family protein [Desulfarculales bacterium]|nr:OmpA family protein [Desulfarculales bacterium]